MLGRQSEYIKTHLDSLCASLSVSPFITSVDALKTLQSFIIFISAHTQSVKRVQEHRKDGKEGHVDVCLLQEKSYFSFFFFFISSVLNGICSRSAGQAKTCSLFLGQWYEKVRETEEE